MFVSTDMKVANYALKQLWESGAAFCQRCRAARIPPVLAPISHLF